MVVLKTFLNEILFADALVSLGVSESGTYVNSENELETGYVVLAKTKSQESIQISDVYSDADDAQDKRDYIINSQLSATVIQI